MIVAITVAILGFGAFWIVPVTLSINTARTAPPAARVVPVDLPDLSISQNPGDKIKDLNFEFEIPWTDVDKTKTKRYRDMTIPTFQSGRKIMIGVSPPTAYVSSFHTWSPIFESEFGRDVESSDYTFVKALYGFSPEKINLWAFSPTIHYRQVQLSTIKNTMLSDRPNPKIFNIQNQHDRGFQMREPEERLESRTPLVLVLA